MGEDVRVDVGNHKVSTHTYTHTLFFFDIQFLSEQSLGLSILITICTLSRFGTDTDGLTERL
jgi:hypothetical protein